MSESRALRTSHPSGIPSRYRLPRLGRRWRGIDIAYQAVQRVARVRLGDRCGLVEDQDLEIEGIPQNAEGASDLWQPDKHRSQCWAVAAVDGFVTEKQSADGGVDGRLYFYLPNDPSHHSMAIEVKGGRYLAGRERHPLFDLDQAARLSETRPGYHGKMQ